MAPHPGDSERGKRAYLSGLAAEDQVARCYENLGAQVLQRRWRGPGGEIDLILLQGDVVIFVEVKSAATHARAATALRPAQRTRILDSASAFLATQPLGQLTETRIDAALVDMQGQIEIIENAFL
jgi:putative endonuclease